MVRFIKAYNKGGETVFEFQSTSLSARSARIKVLSRLFGTMPGEITGLESVDVYLLNRGNIMNQYRVIATVDPTEDIKHKLNIPQAIDFISERL